MELNKQRSALRDIAMVVCVDKSSVSGMMGYAKYKEILRSRVVPFKETFDRSFQHDLDSSHNSILVQTSTDPADEPRGYQQYQPNFYYEYAAASGPLKQTHLSRLLFIGSGGEILPASNATGRPLIDYR
ncbi:hypothetical protein TNCV_4628571 [Trichonephila clavipes]|nr:hypothetical protein TNCV_4628571 [Trichonephila clavipes]